MNYIFCWSRYLREASPLGNGSSRTQILYRAGKRNINADALSRFPVLEKSTHTPSDSPHAVVAATRPPSAPAKGGEADLATLQHKDTELFEVIDYLENGTLPADQKRAQELALCKSQYTVLDGVLYHVEKTRHSK